MMSRARKGGPLGAGARSGVGFRLVAALAPHPPTPRKLESGGVPNPDSPAVLAVPGVEAAELGSAPGTGESVRRRPPKNPPIPAGAFGRCCFVAVAGEGLAAAAVKVADDAGTGEFEREGGDACTVAAAAVESGRKNEVPPGEVERLGWTTGATSEPLLFASVAAEASDVRVGTVPDPFPLPKKLVLRA